VRISRCSSSNVGMTTGLNTTKSDGATRCDTTTYRATICYTATAGFPTYSLKFWIDKVERDRVDWSFVEERCSEAVELMSLHRFGEDVSDHILSWCVDDGEVL
jgi:hypothetical protein